MLTSITSSQVTERLIYLMLVAGRYRKYLARLQQRLDESHAKVVKAFERAGLDLFAELRAGMFLWARCPHVEDSMVVAERACRGFMLAPGKHFAHTWTLAVDAVQRCGVR